MWKVMKINVLTFSAQTFFSRIVSQEIPRIEKIIRFINLQKLINCSETGGNVDSMEEMHFHLWPENWITSQSPLLEHLKLQLKALHAWVTWVNILNVTESNHISFWHIFSLTANHNRHFVSPTKSQFINRRYAHQTFRVHFKLLFFYPHHFLSVAFLRLIYWKLKKNMWKKDFSA